MEKVCEFCTALRPLVYCKADAAYLCLSCDSKVHLANAVSGRHLRNFVCHSCGYHLAYVLCLEHKMLICRDCDQKLHNISLPHKKRAIRSFMGCPSAKDFAALWGFESNEIENSATQDQFGSVSCVSADLNVAQVSGMPGIQTGIPSMPSGAKFDGGGSTSQQGQLWSQNIQDLGICKELVCQDDFNIPDVDLTFQNFEELFGGDQDPIRILLDDQDVSCSSLEKDKSVGKSDIDNPSAMEESSAAASITISQSDLDNKDMNPLSQYRPRSMDPALAIRPFDSTIPFSVLRFNEESSCTSHDDSALSPYSERKAYSGS
ncbi:hypothetical protein GYH30_055621 [Glycine max]|nr:hypothetical protein GYH30_055621 [Glycine max]